MGVDLGTKRVGIAISDPDGVIAFPRDIFDADPNVPEKILSLARSEGATAIILGESKEFKGQDNPIMHDVYALKAYLEASHMPVYLESETFSSVEARRSREDQRPIDASAAAIILQSFLDSSVKKAL